MEFYAGSTHTAKAVMHNPTTAPFDYQGILFMGIEQASMAEKAFHLEAGQSEEVSFPVVMPTALGSYPVYIGVFSGGVFLEPLRQGENVAVIAQAGPFNMSIIRIDTDTDKYYSSYWVMLPVAVIANPHSAVITHQLRVIAAPGSSNPELFSSYEWTRYWGGAPIGTPHENLSQELSVTHWCCIVRKCAYEGEAY